MKAIAQSLAMVPSTCLHILRVLVDEELVKVDATKRYSLGAGMLSLARSVIHEATATEADLARVEPARTPSKRSSSSAANESIDLQ